MPSSTPYFSMAARVSPPPASEKALLLAMALVGVGFNVKMAAALVLAPTLGLVYLTEALAAQLAETVLAPAGATPLLADLFCWRFAD